MISFSAMDILTIVGSVLAAVGPMVWGLLKALQKAQNASLEKQLNAQNESLEKQFKTTNTAIKAVSDENGRQAQTMLELERKFMTHQVELAQHYVRRDDFIRIVGSIDGKIDNMAMRIERAVISLGGKVQ